MRSGLRSKVMLEGLRLKAERDAHLCNCRAAVQRRLQGQFRSKFDDLVEGDMQALRIICDFMPSCRKSISPVVHPPKPGNSTSCHEQTVRLPPGLLPPGLLPATPVGLCARRC